MQLTLYRLAIRCVAVGVLGLFPWLAGEVLAEKLPPSVRADQYLMAVKEHVEAGEHRKAQDFFDKILALDVEVPPAFHYHYARNLSALENPIKAEEAVIAYLEKTGAEGEHYKAALELLNEVEPKAEKRREQREREQQAAARAERQGLSLTLDDPNPWGDDHFGKTVALSANGEMMAVTARYGRLIGDRLAGDVHLYSSDGNHQGTFQLPERKIEDEFGMSLSLSADGSRLLVGSHEEKAFLFDTSGSLLHTFVPPENEFLFDFGELVDLSADASRILISANSRDRVYLFSASGELLQRYTPPEEVEGDQFGKALALSADGSRALIAGDRSYLFSTQGQLLQTFDDTGRDVDLSADGSRVLIGSPRSRDDEDPMQVSLYAADGNRLQRLNDPRTEVRASGFGRDVALSADGTRLLVGAMNQDNAYLFSAEGELLQSFDAPTTSNFYFGASVAISSAGDKLLIGDPGPPGASTEYASQNEDSGQAYLFQVPASTDSGQ